MLGLSKANGLSLGAEPGSGAQGARGGRDGLSKHGYGCWCEFLGMVSLWKKGFPETLLLKLVSRVLFDKFYGGDAAGLALWSAARSFQFSKVAGGSSTGRHISLRSTPRGLVADALCHVRLAGLRGVTVCAHYIHPTEPWAFTAPIEIWRALSPQTSRSDFCIPWSASFPSPHSTSTRIRPSGCFHITLRLENLGEGERFAIFCRQDGLRSDGDGRR